MLKLAVAVPSTSPELAQDIEQAFDLIQNNSFEVVLQRFKLSFMMYVPRLVGAIFLLFLSHAVIKGIDKLIKSILAKSKIDPTIHSFIRGIVRNGLRFLVIVCVLLILNVPTTPLVTIIGSIGLALSLALKDSLSNIAGGISILVNRPFAKGDLIQVKDVVGIVKTVDLVYTKIITDDERTVFLPNGDCAKSVVINFSAEPLKRLDFEFFIPINSEFEKAKDIILFVLNNNAYTLSKPEPMVTVIGHNNDSYTVSCKTWTKADRYDKVIGPINEEIDRRLKEAGM